MANTAWVFLYTKDNTAPQTQYLKTSSVNIAKGHVVYFVSGYCTTATVANVRTSNVAGVSEADITTSDSEVPVQVNRAAVYRAFTNSTPSQAMIGLDCTLDDFNEIDENDTGTGSTHVARIEKLISATDLTVEASLNYSATGALS